MEDVRSDDKEIPKPATIMFATETSQVDLLLQCYSSWSRLLRVMSWVLRHCTVCSGDHSIFHCENKCGVCHGDSRQCSCNERPPQKRKKISKSTASSQQPADTSHDDLKKKYESLQKDYKRVGQAFQNQQEQNQELKALLEEREKEAEELANLVRNKDEVVKNLERRHVDAETNPRHKKTHPHHNSNTSRRQTYASAPTAWPTYTNDMTRFSRR